MERLEAQHGSGSSRLLLQSMFGSGESFADLVGLFDGVASDQMRAQARQFGEMREQFSELVEQQRGPR